MFQVPVAQAQTNAELLAQIENLLAIVESLRQQVLERQSGSSTQQNSCVFTRNLTLGDQGEDVARLQQLLRQSGYFDYPTNTGFFGPATERAMVRFQEAKRISPAVGFFGPLTQAAVESFCRPGDSSVAEQEDDSSGQQAKEVEFNIDLDIVDPNERTIELEVTSASCEEVEINWGDDETDTFRNIVGNECEGVKNNFVKSHTYGEEGEYRIRVTYGDERLRKSVTFKDDDIEDDTPAESVEDPDHGLDTTTSSGVVEPQATSPVQASQGTQNDDVATAVTIGSQTTTRPGFSVKAFPVVGKTPLRVNIVIETDSCDAYSINWGDGTGEGATKEEGVKGEDCGIRTLTHTHVYAKRSKSIDRTIKVIQGSDVAKTVVRLWPSTFEARNTFDLIPLTINNEDYGEPRDYENSLNVQAKVSSGACESVAIFWGDGTATWYGKQVNSPGCIQIATLRSVNHTYEKAGRYAVTVRVGRKVETNIIDVPLGI